MNMLNGGEGLKRQNICQEDPELSLDPNGDLTPTLQSTPYVRYSPLLEFSVSLCWLRQRAMILASSIFPPP